MPVNETPPEPREENKLDGRLRYATRLPRARLMSALEAGDRPSNVRRLNFRGYAAEALDLDDAAAADAWLEVMPARVPAPLLHGLRVQGDEVFASIFIRSRCTRERLEELGAKVLSVSADVATADVPLAVVERLAEDPDVLFVELSRPCFPQLDRSVPEMQVDALHRASAPIRGAGTVVGIIDIDGIDFRHPDFSVLDGGVPRTRLLGLWDQPATPAPVGTGRAPAPWDYGVEYTRADLDRDLASGVPGSVVPHHPDVPPDGKASHGTHMAGVAAGNGRALGGKYTGVAPEAEIVFVNTRGSGTDGFGDMSRVCDAIAYIFDRAGGRPCVIDISLGDNLGPHDGTSMVERFIDGAVATPGRAVVVSAGNSNDLELHTAFDVPPAGSARVELFIPPSTCDAEAIEIWYGGDDRLDLAVTAPGAAAPGLLVRAGEETSVRLGMAKVHVESLVRDGRNGDSVIVLLIEPDETVGRIGSGDWRLELRRSAGFTPPASLRRCHAWIDGNTRARWRRPSKGSYTLCTPATARGAIVVGNTMRILGAPASDTSGRGPTRDGREKPDLAAPGTGIMGPLACAPPGRPEGPYAAGCGTSQAAAHVAGLVALLYQCRGAHLDVPALRSILTRTADKLGIDGRWDPGLGRGRARAAGASTAPLLMEARSNRVAGRIGDPPTQERSK